MSQHFLLSSRAKGIRLADVFTLPERDIEVTFCKLRWPQTDGAPVCPHCGGMRSYECRRPSGALRFRCKECGADFSITSGTLFASHKKPLRVYLAAIVLFVNEVKGKSMLALSRDLGTSYKAAFVLAHKLREAMAEEMKGREIGDDQPEAEVDSAVFGSYVRPANLRTDRVDRRMLAHQSAKKQLVIVLRERGGETLPGVFQTEKQALGWIKRRIRKGTTVHADGSSSWNDLHARFEMKRIDHDEAYSKDGACTNWAESYFSRMRRMEIGHHHHIAGPYLLRYAQEAAWREDNRRQSNATHARKISEAALGRKPSVDFCGYWQRHQLG